MSLFTLVMLLVASTVVTLTVLTTGLLDSMEEGSGQGPAKSISDTQLRFISIVLGVFLLVAVGLVYGMIWISSVAPPDYISQKIAESQDPECIQRRLEKVIESRALNRQDVLRAGKLCNRGTKAGVPIRVQQKEALRSGG